MAEYRRPTGPEAVRRFNEEPGWGQFPSMIGLEMLEVERDRIRGRLETTERLIAGTGYLWAPVIVGLADALCAAGTGANIPEGATFTTVELKVNYFRPVTEGRLVARSRLLRIGSSIAVGQVDLSDAKRRSVGVAIVTYMFIDAPKTA